MKEYIVTCHNDQWSAAFRNCSIGGGTRNGGENGGERDPLENFAASSAGGKSVISEGTLKCSHKLENRKVFMDVSGLTFIVIIAIALGVSFAIVIAGVVCLKRWVSKNEHSPVLVHYRTFVCLLPFLCIIVGQKEG